jgi:RNA polymerase sigma-70 factor
MKQKILEAFERCQRRYPTVQLSIDDFRARVNEIVLSESNPAGGGIFEKIHCEDLFLAIACSRDDRVAWEHFADDYLPIIRQFAAQACRNSHEAEDLAQEITTKLLNEKRRLAGYNGRGSLAGWLRVTVSHATIDRFRKMNRQVSLEDLQESGSMPEISKPANSEEDETLDRRWGPIISRVAGECLRRLAARDRLLLALYYLHGIPLKDLGRQFGIHEATASRWLDRMRRDIRKDVERELREKHGLRSSELESLWKWVSPSLLAESIGDGRVGADSRFPGSGGERSKKTAIGENPGVIKKEELR